MTSRRPFYYGTGGLDQTRLDWLKNELQKGQDDGQLMIIAAHIPINPQATLSRPYTLACLLRQARRRPVAGHPPRLSQPDFVDRGTSARERGYRPAE